jgi:hypothetical protein
MSLLVPATRPLYTGDLILNRGRVIFDFSVKYGATALVPWQLQYACYTVL